LPDFTKLAARSLNSFIRHAFYISVMLFFSWDDGNIPIEFIPMEHPMKHSNRIIVFHQKSIYILFNTTGHLLLTIKCMVRIQILVHKIWTAYGILWKFGLFLCIL